MPRQPERRSSRQERMDELLGIMLPWDPRERIGAFKAWLRGSLSLIHLFVLTTLETEGPLSMSHLAEALDVSVASATGIVSRMEERGLVERRHGASDRRVVQVHVTAAGADVFRTMDDARSHAFRGASSNGSPMTSWRACSSDCARPGPRGPRWPPTPRPGRRATRDRAPADLPAAVCRAARRGHDPAAHRGDREPDAARPQRRHHRPGRRQGRYGLHPPDRRPDAGRDGAPRGRVGAGGVLRRSRLDALRA